MTVGLAVVLTVGLTVTAASCGLMRRLMMWLLLLAGAAGLVVTAGLLATTGAVVTVLGAPVPPQLEWSLTVQLAWDPSALQFIVPQDSWQ